LTARDLLQLGPLDLMELLGLSWAQAGQLLADVSAQITPPYTTAWEALEQQSAGVAAAPLRSGLPTLDAALRRGLPPGCITEAVGPGGVGKSQLCHMMALRAALPLAYGGLAAGVVYIDTEKKFSVGRLAEMLHASAPLEQQHQEQQQQQQHHQQQQQAQQQQGQQLGGGAVLGGVPGVVPPLHVQEVLHRVVVMSPGSTAELESMLMTLETVLLRHRARLVIVDSIAALARTEYGKTTEASASAAAAVASTSFPAPRLGSIMERQEVLGRIAAQLKLLAESLRIPVLVTNQVTTRFGPAPGGRQQQHLGGGYGGGQLTAALGTKWSHCVNVRLVLERLGDRRFLKQLAGGDLPAALHGNVLDMAIGNDVDYGNDYY
ncbi:DNA repair protein RAD51 2, partial [Tetrabaena socialis]